MRRLRVLTWHVHGSYLYYLSHARADFFLPVAANPAGGYGGRGDSFPFGDNVHEVPLDDLSHREFDCILFQSPKPYLEDQYRILSPVQRALPKVYLEHDPPRQHPTDTRHVAADGDALIVHVTPFNALMWDNGDADVRVIDHGVIVPDSALYTGQLERGVVVVNNIATRGRRLGADIFERARRAVPLDLIGMGAEAVGGLGEIPPPDVPAFVSRYRFFFSPIRYTSLGLAVCEAMMCGVPVVALATAEMASAIDDGITGYASTNPDRLSDDMLRLLGDPAEARHVGEAGRAYARERFGIERFARDWERLFADVTGLRVADALVRGVQSMRRAAI